jgi:hypothetical protein
MSYASEHLVRCARQEDLGCPARFPGSKFDAIDAGVEGWFFSRQDDLAYCPEHVPGWVPGWRARKSAGPPRPRSLELPPEGPEREAFLAAHAGDPFG